MYIVCAKLKFLTGYSIIYNEQFKNRGWLSTFKKFSRLRVKKNNEKWETVMTNCFPGSNKHIAHLTC